MSELRLGVSGGPVPPFQEKLCGLLSHQSFADGGRVWRGLLFVFMPQVDLNNFSETHGRFFFPRQQLEVDFVGGDSGDALGDEFFFGSFEFDDHVFDRGRGDDAKKFREGCFKEVTVELGVAAGV